MFKNTLLENLIYSAHKFHFADFCLSYDMSYYPSFIFYYSKINETYPQLRFLSPNFNINYSISKSTINCEQSDIKTIANFGMNMWDFKIDPANKDKLEKLCKNVRFITSPDIVKFLSENEIEIPLNHDYNEVEFNVFPQIYDSLISFWVDSYVSYFDNTSLSILEQEEAFFRNYKNMINIDVQLSPKTVAKLAEIVIYEIDRYTISFEDLIVNVSHPIEILPEIESSFTSKSRTVFKSLIGMKVVLDALEN